MNSLLNVLAADWEQIQSWRHHLHRHPEVAFAEAGTAEYIAGLLRDWGYDVHTGIGKTGVVALLTEDRTATPDAAQLKAVNVAAAFLARQMEE